MVCCASFGCLVGQSCVALLQFKQTNVQTNKQPNKKTNNGGNKEAQLRYFPHVVDEGLNARWHIALLFDCAGCHSSATTRLLVEHDHGVMENGVLVSIY